jgi:CRISPR/Cas system-associated exonuclease Cas4 (RecB family)|tara:strand:+ start:2191 stop:2868 length:678 start_codon:yes stop_codon:yes gene_type:complete
MLLTEKIEYKKLERVTTAEGRKYVGDDNVPVPSVTTVLDKTSDKTALIAWRKRVGDAEANRVSKESAGLGTKVHNALEQYILGEDYEIKGNNFVSILARDMANLMINEGFTNVNEVWGTEVGLIAPGLYAGTTDCIGMHNGDEAIIDFKTSKKIKPAKWVQDYFLQCCAYAMAHNEMYGTKIRKGVILMVSRDVELKEYVIEGEEFDKYCGLWTSRLEEYYSKFG